LPKGKSVEVDGERRMNTIPLVASGLLAVLACAGPSETAAVEWIMVAETGPVEEGFITYAGPATIRRSGTTVRMVSLIDSTMAEDVARERHRVSWKDEWEYDCQDRQVRPLQFTEYAGRMGTGEKMFSHRVPTFVWSKLTPGSVGEQLWRIACGKE